MSRISPLVCAMVAVARVTSAHADAQPSSPSPAPRAMTLGDAIAYARAHQPQVRAALARVAARKADADVPRAQWQPIVGVTAQLFGATANNTTGTFTTPGFMDIP